MTGTSPPATRPASANLTRHHRPVSHTRVTFDDAFWAPRQRVNRESTIPHILNELRRTGRLAAQRGEWDPAVVKRGVLGGNVPVLFWDSDVAKWIEAASYSLATHPDPALEAQVDEAIAAIAAGQRDDGYLNSWFGFVEPGKRWSNLRDWHELYDAGHLIEAAVAHVQATGKRSLVDILARYIDHIATTFGPDDAQRHGYCGHPEIELALIRLSQATGERRYLDLARYFVDERGRQPHYFDQEAVARGENPKDYWFKGYEYSQSHKPVREQTEVVGHAVRAAYLYSAMADLAAIDGDPELLAACQRLWRHLTTKRMYVMGGIGSSKHNEGFTDDYDLPNDSAYAETCAAIALIFWAQRMLQVDLDRRYADVLELALYNAVLSGVSADGSRFFYDNPLASAGAHHRQSWFVCPCCPPNLSRIIASLGGYLYTQTETEVAVHLYAQSSAELLLGGGAVTLRQETRYPWDGTITVTVGVTAATTFALSLRLPAWCRAPRLSVNGVEQPMAASANGYARVERAWQNGDTVVLALPMPAERVYAHPAVVADQARVALRRGPIVYCFEQVDHDVPVTRVLLPPEAELAARFVPDLVNGVVVIEGAGLCLSDRGWDDELYRSAPPGYEPCTWRAVPYAVWDNRAAGPMTVWVPEPHDRAAR